MNTGLGMALLMVVGFGSSGNNTVVRDHDRLWKEVGDPDGLTANPLCTANPSLGIFERHPVVDEERRRGMADPMRAERPEGSAARVIVRFSSSESAFTVRGRGSPAPCERKTQPGSSAELGPVGEGSSSVGRPRSR